MTDEHGKLYGITFRSPTVNICADMTKKYCELQFSAQYKADFEVLWPSRASHWIMDRMVIDTANENPTPPG